MRRFLKPLIGTAVALFAAVVAWVQAPATQPPSLARVLPTGAMLTIEARDFSALLADWNASPEKQTWFGSDNYEVFARSKLFYRLNEARGEFAAAAGVPLELAWIESIAGGESALGLYDIGDLRFVYVTEIAEARALESALWQKRADFEARSVTGQTFYVRSNADSGREAAFGVVDGRLMLATSADLAAQTVTLLAGGAGLAVTAEDWYDDATQAAGPRSELRLAHNLQALLRTPHFRSYWIQQNASALRSYRAGVSDVLRSPERLREQRVLLKAPGDQPRSAMQTALGPLLSRVPAEAGLYQLWASPSGEQAVALLQRKLLSPGPSDAYGPHSYAPPPPNGATSAGSEAALETRIDQAPSDRSAEVFDPTPLAALFEEAGVKAMLHLQSQRPGPDRALPTHDACIFIELDRPAALEPLVQAVSAASAGLWTVSGIGANWEQGDQIFALEGLNPLFAWVGGSQVALANSAQLLRAAIANRPAPASPPGAVFAAGFRHARETGLYQTTMARIEHLENGPASQDPGREPNLFSENIASLSRTFDRIVEVRLERRDLGERIDETVVYERRP